MDRNCKNHEKFEILENFEKKIIDKPVTSLLSSTAFAAKEFFDWDFCRSTAEIF